VAEKPGNYEAYADAESAAVVARDEKRKRELGYKRCPYCRELQNPNRMADHKEYCEQNPARKRAMEDYTKKCTCPYCDEVFTNPNDRNIHVMKCDFNANSFKGDKIQPSNVRDVKEWILAKECDHRDSIPLSPRMPNWQRRQLRKNIIRKGTRQAHTVEEKAIYVLSFQVGDRSLDDVYEDYRDVAITTGRYLTKRQLAYLLDQLKVPKKVVWAGRRRTCIYTFTR